ncbi:hypothetical protein EIP86_010649 [Pleurotus ostreatoroseus]|nr:hypothetical protein EIP86_010649 [Pleurotus ostreatoroseus]
MDPSRRRQPPIATGRRPGGSGEAPRQNLRTNPQAATPKFEVGQLVKLKVDIPGTDFKAGEIVIVAARRDDPTQGTPEKPGSNQNYSANVPYVPDPATMLYKVYRRLSVVRTTYYYSRDSGVQGAPHHSDLSLTVGGTAEPRRLKSGSRVYLKRAVQVYDNKDSREAKMLVAPAGTCCFVVNDVTNRVCRSLLHWFTSH